jgi:hypothetical protein
MKIVRVIYTARPEYVPQNSANISAVMNDLRQAGHAGIFYHSCLGADGKTFTHTAFFESEEDHKLLNALPSFKAFQEKLQASGFEAPPKQELLTLVGASKSIF